MGLKQKRHKLNHELLIDKSHIHDINFIYKGPHATTLPHFSPMQRKKPTWKMLPRKESVSVRLEMFRGHRNNLVISFFIDKKEKIWEERQEGE